MSEKSPTVEIVDGLAREHVEDALRVLYEAFANKFRIGLPRTSFGSLEARWTETVACRP